MDEAIEHDRWKSLPPLQRKPVECLYDKLLNAVWLDDKDEFLKLIKDPEFEPMRQYHRSESLILREFNADMILGNDALQIALAMINGETRGIIDKGDLLFDFPDGWTPLHLASSTPCPKLTEYLIQRGHPVDATADYPDLDLEQATPLDLALEVLDFGYDKTCINLDRPWTPHRSIFELLEYVCESKRRCLEVIRLLVQNTQDKERLRKAFFDYADEGKLVKVAALFVAAPELFISTSLGEGGSMSSIDELYLNLNSLDKTTDIQNGLLLLLDVFALVGHMLVAYLRVDDPEVWKLKSSDNQYKIGFFLREAAHKKQGISSHDDYLLSFFKSVSPVYPPSPGYPPFYPGPTTVAYHFIHEWKILPFEMERKDIDIDYVNRMIPSLKHHEAALLRKAIENKLSTMPELHALFEGTTTIPNKGGKQMSPSPFGRSIENLRIPNKGGKQRPSFPPGMSMELTSERSFCTETANAKRKLDFKLILGNTLESRVMNSTKLESTFSAVRLSHFPMIMKRLIK